MLSIIFCLLLNPFLNNPISAESNNIYYISNNGNDSNTGLSPSNPWKTIDKVNLEMNNGVINVGDNIYFNRSNLFFGTIECRLGGTKDNYMILGAYGAGEKPIIDSLGEEHCIDLSWRDSSGYYLFENLFLKSSTHDAISIGVNKRNNISIKNIDIGEPNKGKTIGRHGIYIDRVVNYSIENVNTFGCGIILYGDTEETLSNGRVWNCTVDGQNISYGGIVFHRAHSESTNDGCGVMHHIKNCTVFNNDGNTGAFIFGMGSDFLVENCTVYGQCKSAFGIDHEVRNITVQFCNVYDTTGFGFYIQATNNTIIRSNNIWNTYYDPIQLYPTDWGSWANEEGGAKNVAIYNNNFMYSTNWYGTINRLVSINHDYYLEISIKNNVFASYSLSPRYLYQSFAAQIPPNPHILFDRNIWWHPAQSNTDFWHNYINSIDILNWNAYYPTDMFEDPKMTDPENNDFSLQTNSPAIDRGAFLTSSEGSGSGTLITVDNVNYFSDGHGIADGDIIFIGDELNLRVVSIDRANNQLLINRSITWSDNDDIGLYPFHGSKVDIGSFEYFIDQIDPIAISGLLETSSSPLDTDPDFGWINISCVIDCSDLDIIKINCTMPQGTSNNESMNKGPGNNYYYNLSFDAPGEYIYTIWCKDKNGNTDTTDQIHYLMPPNWDIDMNGVCDMLDLVLVSESYDLENAPGWIREDINNDNIVNMLDLLEVSSHIDETWI